MFVVHMNDTEFVIVMCDEDKNPVKYLQDTVVRLDYTQSILFTRSIKGACRFSNFETAINVFKNIKSLFDSDFCENLTVGRIYGELGEDELLCLYD